MSNEDKVLERLHSPLLKFATTSHPTSRITLCLQKAGIQFEFQDRGIGRCMLSVDRTAAGWALVLKGEGQNKKEAKKAVCEQLIDRVLKGVDTSCTDGRTGAGCIGVGSDGAGDEVARDYNDAVNDMRCGVDILEHDLRTQGDHTGLWRECLTQLVHKETDLVTYLSIFTFNIGADPPKFKVEPGPNRNVKCTVTWNLFFVEGEGRNTGEAENKATRKLVNKVRSMCGLAELSAAAVQDSAVEPTVEADSDSDDESGIPRELRRQLVNNSCILANNPTGKRKDNLELFATKLCCGILPLYKVASVETVGRTQAVKVSCSWLSLSSWGRGWDRETAEEEAAAGMVTEVLRVIQEFKVRKKKNSEESRDGGSGEPEQVRYLIYPGKQHPLGKDSVTITNKDYLCLREGEFLNDTIIDFYLQYLKAGRFYSNKMMERTHIFSIYFYERLTKKSLRSSTSAIPPAELMHANVKKWTKNVNIFQKDFVVIPINENDHWYVVIVCYPGLTRREATKVEVRQPLLLILDSLEDGLKAAVCKNIRTYLTVEWRQQMGSQRSFENLPSFCPVLPQQDNLTDCGLFLLQYVEHFYRSPVQTLDIPVPSLADWFSLDRVAKKRRQIARLIRSLAAAAGQNDPAPQYPDLGFPQQQLEQEEEEVMSESEFEWRPQDVEAAPEPEPVKVVVESGGVAGKRKTCEQEQPSKKSRMNEADQEDEEDENYEDEEGWWCNY